MKQRATMEAPNTILDKPTSPTLCFFGRPRLTSDEICIDSFATKRSAYLLARVAIARQKRMLRSDLAEVLWPGDYYDATRLRLRQELTRLRKTLDNWADIVSTQGDWIALDVSRLKVDVDEFESSIRRAREESDLERKEELLRRAISLGELPFMDGAQEDWIEAERGRLTDLRYAAIVDLATMLSHTQAEEALGIARQATELLPSREAGHLLVMQLLGDMGHLADALTQYQVLRRNVAEASGGRLSARAEQLAASLREPAAAQMEPSPVTTCWPGIPVSPEPIFGRDPETELIARRLDPVAGSARLVTLLGIGGIGKTHLLLHAARQLSPKFARRAVFVDLTEISDPRLVPLAILGAFGATHRRVDDPMANLRDTIPNEPFLLALDNLEQLGESLAPILKRLLSERPHLRILGSSRTALNVSGEFRLALTPLGLPPASAHREVGQVSAAVQMFVRAVEASRLGTKIHDADWPLISDIVRLLEGLPLALQLAASRFHVLGATGLFRALSSHPELTNSRKDAPARHRTIRTAVAGSFDQLEPELVHAMEALSTFRGGWTLEAAGDLCQTDNPMPIMERLLDASLVYISEEGPRIRFRMLESIRQYVYASLDAEQVAAFQRRHLDWIRAAAAGLSSEIVTTEGLARLDALEPETDNIREALRFALETDPGAAYELGANLAFFWLYRTNCFEADCFYHELFERCADWPLDETVLRASYGHCVSSMMLDDTRRPVVLDRTLSISQKIGDVRWRAKILVQILYQLQNVMDYDRCRSTIKEIEEWVASNGHYDDEGFILRAKGNFLYYQGDLAAALADFREGLTWFEARGCVFSQVRMKLHIARASMEAGEFDSASRALRGLVAEVRHIRFALLDAAICETAGRLELRIGNYDEAMRRFNESEAGWRQGFYGFQVAAQFNHRGRVYLAVGNLEKATRSFADAAVMWSAMNYPVAASVALYGMAGVCLELGQIPNAARYFGAALQEISRIGAKLVPFEQDFADQCGAAIRALGGDIDIPSPLLEAVENAREMAAAI